MSRLYMSVDGDGRPDRAWMAAFVRVLISRFREVWRLPIPRRREPRSEPPRFARRRRCARRTSRLSTSGPECGEPSRRPRSRAHIGRKRHGKAVRPDSCRGAATREPASVPATTSSSIPAGAQQPPMGRIPCPEGLGAHAGFHAARLRPFDPNTRPGAPWTRRVARRQAASKGRDTFSGSSPHALRARTTRKTAVGRLLFPCPTSLPPLQARPRCMRLTRRKARHRGGPQSLRSKT